MQYEEIELTDNKEDHLYELWVDGKKSFIEYQPGENNKIVLLHTEVSKDLEGTGVAAALVRKTFELLEMQDQKVIPVCSYIRLFLKRNREWNRLL